MVVRSEPAPGTGNEQWLILENQAEAPARNVRLELRRIKGGLPTEGELIIRSRLELPIVALGPGQRYPLRVMFKGGFSVFIAVISWEDDAGERAAEFQVANTSRFDW